MPRVPRALPTSRTFAPRVDAGSFPAVSEHSESQVQVLNKTLLQPWRHPWRLVTSPPLGRVWYHRSPAPSSETLPGSRPQTANPQSAPPPNASLLPARGVSSTVDSLRPLRSSGEEKIQPQPPPPAPRPGQPPQGGAFHAGGLRGGGAPSSFRTLGSRIRAWLFLGKTKTPWKSVEGRGAEVTVALSRRRWPCALSRPGCLTPPRPQMPRLLSVCISSYATCGHSLSPCGIILWI